MKRLSINQYVVLSAKAHNTIATVQERLANFSAPKPGEAYELSKTLWEIFDDAEVGEMYHGDAGFVGGER